MSVAAPPGFPPVTTEGGDTARRYGIRCLTGRRDALLERHTKRGLTRLEERELRATDAALEQLEAMAPTGPVLSFRDHRLAELGLK